MRKLVVVLFSLGLMAGCTSTDSEFVDTDGITAIFDVEVTEQDGGATVLAILHQGDADSSTYVKMSGGDKLMAAVSIAGGQYTDDHAMDESAAFGITAYQADFSYDEGGEEFKVQFDRSGSGKASAMNSSVVLPPEFEITSSGTCDMNMADYCVVNQVAASSFTRATDNLFFNYDNADTGEDYDIVFTAEGACIEPMTTGIGSEPVGTAASGAVDLPAGSLQSRSGQESQDCSITFTIARKATGTVDSAFMGGGFIATQIRQVTMTGLGQ